MTSLEPFLATPDATPAPPQEGTPQGLQADTSPQSAQHFQSLYNKTLAQNYALQQQLENFQRMQMEAAQRQQPQTQTTNPYDPNTQWAPWIQWQTEHAAQMAVTGAQQAFEERLQNAMRQNQESQWIAAHPGIDIAGVKAFAQMRSIGNLDDAYTLMTLPTQLANVQAQAINQTFNQVRQPQQTAATPTRGINTNTPTGPVQLSLEKMMEAYMNDPEVENTWHPDVRKEFWKHVTARATEQ
jgi:hypothetical protein